MNNQKGLPQKAGLFPLSTNIDYRKQTPPLELTFHHFCYNLTFLLQASWEQKK